MFSNHSLSTQRVQIFRVHLLEWETFKYKIKDHNAEVQTRREKYTTVHNWSFMLYEKNIYIITIYITHYKYAAVR